MGLKLITPPASDPITLAEAKTHLHVVDNDYDALIAALVKSATQHSENFTGRAFIDQTWELVLDAFPTDGDMEILIPKPPLISVLQVAYDNGAGLETILAADSYYVDTVSQPGWIVPVTGGWPGTLDAINSVRVRYRAGYLDNNSPPAAAVPQDICAGIKLFLGALFEQREAQVVGTTAMRLPWSAEQLLRQHRVLLGMA